MIKLENITKKYNQKTVYNNFNLNFNEGEILCVLGASGSGKTTLLNILAGITDFQGKIKGNINKISYIFQEDRLLDNLTVKQNISYVTGTDEGISDILNLIEMDSTENLYPKQLSGGMKRRVSMARAFAYPSNLILMDEPFSNLDLNLKIKLIKMFKTLWKNNNKTTVFVTHDLDEAIMLSDRIIMIENAHIIEDLILPKTQKEYDSYPDIKKQLLNKIIK